MEDLRKSVVAGGVKIHDGESIFLAKIATVMDEIEKKLTYVSKISEGMASEGLSRDPDYIAFKKDTIKDLISHQRSQIRNVIEDAFKKSIVSVAQKVENETLKSFVVDGRRSGYVTEMPIEGGTKQIRRKSSKYLNEDTISPSFVSVADETNDMLKIIKKKRKGQKPVKKSRKRVATKKITRRTKA
jgi:hypothetical protein